MLSKSGYTVSNFRVVLISSILIALFGILIKWANVFSISDSIIQFVFSNSLKINAIRFEDFVNKNENDLIDTHFFRQNESFVSFDNTMPKKWYNVDYTIDSAKQFGLKSAYFFDENGYLYFAQKIKKSNNTSSLFVVKLFCKKHVLYDIDKNNTVYFNGFNEHVLAKISFIILSISLILGVYSLRLYVKKTTTKRVRTKLFVVTFFFIGLCFVIYWFDFPNVFSEFDICKPNVFANRFLGNSLAEFLLRAFLLYSFISLLFKLMKNRFLNLNIDKDNIYYLLGIAVITSILFNGYVYAIKSLVFDSNIQFSLSYFLQNKLSFLFVFITCAYVIFIIIKVGIFIVSDIVQIRKIKFTPKHISLCIAVTILVQFIVHVDIDFIFNVFVVLYLIVLFSLIYLYAERRKISMFILILFITFSAFFTTYFIQYFKVEKDKLALTLLADKLKHLRDPLLELSLFDINDRIKSDSTVMNLLHEKTINTPELVRSIEKKLSKDERLNYNIIAHVFDENYRNIGNTRIPYDYFENIFEVKDNFLNSKTLLYAEKNKGFLYLVLDTIYSPITRYTYIEFINKKYLINGAETNVTITFVNNNQLLSSINDYNNISTRLLQQNLKENGFTSFNNNYYFLKRIDEKNSLIISQPFANWIEYTTLFSFLFCGCLFVLLLTLLVNLIVRILPESLSISAFAASTLRDKILFTFILLLFISFLFVSVVSTFLFNNQLKNSSFETIKANNSKVLDEITNELMLKRSSLEIITEKVKQSVLNDENNVKVYNGNGQNFASDSSYTLMPFTIYQKFKSNQFNQLFDVNNTNYIAYNKLEKPLKPNEYIGFLSFEQSTVPSTSFLLQFVERLLNIYVFLIFVGSMLAYFMSNSLLYPMQQIADKLKTFKFGKSNAKLEYKANDEVGLLVKEYNSMVEKLEQSAAKLAESERNFAWSEMARQIAHEIKNPLTPMKLSIQHLQRAINNNDDNVNELSKKVSNTLIEQIDNLTNIANQFSQFAKTMQINVEDFNLNELLKNAITLFRNEFEGEILFDEKTKNIILYTDKNQLLQVVNNVIKNAVQALENTENAIIKIELIAENNVANINIADNGYGIDDETKVKLFSPNFTTKSSGTGLGLAISKRIIEHLGGNITFDSELNVGTTFSITIPLSKHEA